MKITELLDINLLNEMVEKKYVRIQRHQEYPELRIYNYTEICAYDRVWNSVTLKTRGLIVNQNTHQVLARPFDKFFNYGESDAPTFDLDSDWDDIVVKDKLDGSLGITYRTPDGKVRVATRGSFHSEQAEHATKLIQKYSGMHFDEDTTYLFEIVYPENRIVLDYGKMDELILLGARDIDTGHEYEPDELLDWHWGKAATYPYKTLREALEAPPRPNSEGFVIYSSVLDARVKVKQDDYIALHKIVTGLTKRRVWEIIAEGKELRDLLEIIPDEWHDWTRRTYNELVNEHMMIRRKVLSVYRAVLDDLPAGWVRVDFAMKIKNYKYKGLLFMLLDGKKIENAIWDMVKPRGDE